LKIAINTRLLLKNRLDGIGRFTFETMRRITRLHPEHQFFFLFDRPYDQRFIFAPNIIPVVIPPQTLHPLLYIVWFEIGITNWLKRNKPDLFISPDACLSLSSSTPSLLVIHDLNFEHQPENLPRIWRIYYRKLVPRFARKANRIATVSVTTKEDIVITYSIPDCKIDVVYSGINAGFVPLQELAKAQLKTKFIDGKDFFLVVGSLHPRKNICNLLQAFDLFKRDDQKGLKLVVAGRKLWWTREMENSYKTMNYQNDVVFTGLVSDEEIQKLTGAALASVFVSKFEGFGLPIIEAFNCNTPVITSCTSSMPEVAGNAALFVDPESLNSICEAMQQIVSDSGLRDKLILAGRARKDLFNWDSTADKLWRSVEQIL
jgi:glycosyltransferase involved in cell wall biosynthesis